MPQTDRDQVRKASAVQLWLQESTARVNGRNALLVVQQGEALKTLACVPVVERSDRSMLLVAERALREKRVLVRPKARARANTRGNETSVYIGFAMRVAGRPGAVVFRLLLDPTENQLDDSVLLQRVGGQTLRREEDQINIRKKQLFLPSVARETGRSTAPPPRVSVSEDPSTTAVLAEQTVMLASIAALVDQQDLTQSLHALANRIAQQFCCLRIYIGLRDTRKLAIRAVSGVVDFDPRSAVMVDVVQAMEETRLLGAAICVPDAVDDQAPPHNHASLAEQLNNPALMSVPLVVGSRVEGVLLLERDRAFTAIEATQIERLSLLLSPLLKLKKTDAMGLWQWLRRFLGRGLRSVFGPKRLGLKLGMCLLVALLFASASVTRMFRVDADAAVEASSQRAVVSGFPSFLRRVETRAGDLVKQGDVLAVLDIDELQLERIRWQGEKDKLVKEYRATIAQRDRSKVRVLEAQRAQAQAKIDLLDAQIDRAVLRAPIDGVVISGDLKQALGRPVERGELLFEVASLEDYRLILNLDERDIGWVQKGSTGQLRLRSLTERTFEFTVTSITPVSAPGGGANVFRVEASLPVLPETLRPGMEGVAKVDIEPRAIGWIWTRSFVNWARMQIWKFGGL